MIVHPSIFRAETCICFLWLQVWKVKPGRNGCHGKENSLGGAHFAQLNDVEAHCDRLPRCVFFIWNEKGLDPRQGKAGDAFFCSVDYFADPATPDPGWWVGGRVV